MIELKQKSLYQFRYGISLCLVSTTLMMSAAMGNAVAEDAAVKSITFAPNKEVSFVETITRTKKRDVGENTSISDFVATVDSGDSLSSILRENLGSLSALKEVTRHNKLDTPDTLKPGQKILIPAHLFPNQPDTQPVQLVNSPATHANPENAKQTLPSEEGYLVDLTELSSTINQVPPTQSTASEEQSVLVDLTEVNTSPDRRITVNRGDSLSSILRENFGSLSALREVTRYNNLQTPDALKPGQVILIPGYLQL